MGELSKAAANTKRDYYVSVFEEIERTVDKEFQEMDFENADKRIEMEEQVEAIKRVCKAQEEFLKGMYFE